MENDYSTPNVAVPVFRISASEKDPARRPQRARVA
jgi:hypothetical protein